MGLFGKKKEEPTGGFKFELFGDDRDDKLTQYQMEGLTILAKMEGELESMRRRGELIEPHYYGFRTEDEQDHVAIWFQHPMEGIELMRRYAGRPTKWYRLRDPDERGDYKPFEGEPATFRITNK